MNEQELATFRKEAKDWLYSGHIFARTISFLLDDMTGLVVETKGEMLELYPEIKRVMVYREGSKINFDPWDGKEAEGTRLALKRGSNGKSRI